VILKAAWIVPVTTPPVRHGYIELEGDQIAAIGPRDQHSPPPRTVTDLGDVVLVPGLVNPHAHLELGCYAGQLDPAPLWQWLERLVRLRREPVRVQRERQAAGDGARQALEAGRMSPGSR
jgi:cytosine/adenosine deaminase-related metal-dependent hydrolase